MLGGYQALNTDKEFTSYAVFKLDETNSDTKTLPGELSAVALIAGFSSEESGGTLPEAKTNGRVFIEKLDHRAKFQSDTFFNTYDPEADEPIWKSLVKRAIGFQSDPIDIQEMIWQGIINKYLQNVVIEKTDDGAIVIEVTHRSALRAAEIANIIMEEVILDEKKANEEAQNNQLYYLSNTLAKSLNDLEIAQSNLKVFALENSAMPLENFAVGSLQLDALREQFDRTTQLQDAVAELLLLLKNKTTNQENYISLRQRFPIVDQVEFRRVLGQNEIIGSWSWPDINSVSAVYDTLSERNNRLQSQIETSQKEAERSGQALETYGRLKREEKVAEATYTVLIEQVKAQSMIAGYQPSKSEIYEYPFPSISPSHPNLFQNLTIGGILGLFVSSAIALILGKKRGVYYSKKSLTAGMPARLNASSKTLASLRKKSLNDMEKRIRKKPRPILRDIAVEIHKSGKNLATISSSNTKTTAHDVAQALALTMQTKNIKIATIDFSTTSYDRNFEQEQIASEAFVVSANTGNVSVLRPTDNLAAVELISKKDFLKNIILLNSTFDLIFLCADNDEAVSLLRALDGQDIFHLTLARTKHTKSDILQNMHLLLPIQGLLHD
jgi:capsular polysaccharide biosynthesis protein